MSWQDNVGDFVGWLGDVTGVSDAVTEIAEARSGVSSWGSAAMQVAQVPLETAFVMPLRTITKAGDLYYEDVFKPLMNTTVKPALLGAGAPLWRQQNETYGQYLRRAWDRREEVSVGEAYGSLVTGLSEEVGDVLGDPGRVATRMLGFGSLSGVGNVMDLADGSDWSGLDPFNDRSLDRWRESDLHYASGTIDFGKDLFLDPLNYVGAPVKAVTSAGRGAKIVSASEKAGKSILTRRGFIAQDKLVEAIDSGNHSRFIRLIESETDTGVIAEAALKSRMGITDPDTFAYLASKIGEGDGADLLKTLFSADREAAGRLNAKYGADFELVLNADEVAEAGQRLAARTGDEILDQGDPYLDNLLSEYATSSEGSPAVRAAMDRAREAMRAGDQQAFTRGLDKLVNSGSINAQRFLPNESSALGRAAIRKAERRALRDSIVTVHRPTPRHPFQFIVERPSGLVRPEQADAYGELVAVMREIDQLTKGELVRSGLADDVTERWLRAGTLPDPQSARGAVAHSLNQIGLHLIAKRYGVSNADVLDDMFRRATEKTQKAQKLAREKGWLGMATDSGALAILRSPVLMRTTPNAVQMWDMRRINSFFARMEGTKFDSIYHSALASEGLDTLDLVNSLFKVSVLMRLGYTIRNLTEATWSIAATGNVGNVLSAVGPERVATWLRTGQNASRRTIDRVARSFNLRDDVAINQSNWEAADGAFTAWSTHHQDLADRLAQVDADSMLLSDDPDVVEVGQKIKAAQIQLGMREETYFGMRDGSGFALDPDRPLSTTGSLAAAQRHADQAWQPMTVIDYSETGTKRGLLSPHPDIDRSLAGGKTAPAYHGTAKRPGDNRDPDVRRRAIEKGADADERGLIATRVAPQLLVGPGYPYATSSRSTAAGYARNAAWSTEKPGKVHTVIWTGFRSPVVFDADRPWREIPEAVDFFDGYAEGLTEAMREVGLFDWIIRDDQWARVLDDARTNALTPERIRDTRSGGYTSEYMDAFIRLMDDVVNDATRLRNLGDPSEVAVKAMSSMVERYPFTGRQKDLIARAQRLLDGGDWDPADIGEIIQEAVGEYPAAYWWNLNGDQDLIGQMTGLSATMIERIVTDEVNGPAVTAFTERYFGMTPKQIRDAWESPYDPEGVFGQLDDYADDPLGAQLQAQVKTWLQDAFNRRLLDEGYDVIRHTGGLNLAAGMADTPTHTTHVFLSNEHVRQVGDDWLDYDNAKILAAARNMAIDLLEQVRSGAKVRRIVRDERAPLGVVGGQESVDYKIVTESEILGWLDNPTLMARAFKYSERKKNPFSFKDTFEVLPPGATPTVAPVESYGRTADLTDWAKVPDELKSAMGWKHHLVKGGNRRKRAFTGDRRAAKVGDQKAIDQIARTAFDNGFDRVILPDSKAFGGVQVLVNPAAVGVPGLRRQVQKEVDRLTAARMGQGFDTPDVPTRLTRAERKAEKAAYRANGNQAPRPVVPDLDAVIGQTMLNGGLADTVSHILTKRAEAYVRREAAGIRLAAAQRRHSSMAPLLQQGKAFGQSKLFSMVGPYGENYDIMGPFAGHAGTLHHRLTSADDSYHHLILGSDLVAHAGAAPVPQQLDPGNPRFFEGWANILNMHFRDPDSKVIDPVVGRILQGMDYEDAVRWATTTREGYDWAHAIGLPRTKARGEAAQEAADAARDAAAKGGKFDPDTVEEALAGLYRAVDLYLPDGPVRQQFLAGGAIDAETIRKAREGMENSPIWALLVPTSKEARMDWKAKDRINHRVTQIMRTLGAIPETSFARHPLYATYYRDQVRNRISIAAERKGSALTKGELDAIFADSHTMAKRDLEKTLYTIVRRTNLSGAAVPRLLFPFASAYENVLRRWGGFVAEDPSMPLRAGVMIAKFLSNTRFMNEQGEPLQGGEVTPESYLVLPGLDSIAKFVPGKYGRALESQAKSIQIPFASLDVLFQGRPGDPGLGPFALLPIAEVLKRKPSLETYLGWTMPYGVPESQMDVFLPAWAKRVKSMWSEDATYANTVADVYLVEQWKFEQGQRDSQPTLREVEETASAFFAIRMLTNLTAPVSVQYTNERDFYVAKLRALREKYKGEPDGFRKAEAEFFLLFPDTQLLVQSLSRNVSGATATTKSVDSLQQYRAEAARAFAMDDPELAGFIANYGQSGAEGFSDAAYDWQKANSAVAGSTETYRQVANPEESVRLAHISEGWRQWRSFTEQVEARMVASGLQPESAQYVKILQAAKSYAADTIGASNQDWRFEYINPDSSKYFRRAAYFEELVEDSQFARDKGGDPLMRSIDMYLSERRRVAEQVEARAAAGGNKTLAAQSNLDIAMQWEAIVSRLKADSPEFAEWQQRYFANDPVVMR